jgi:putative tricarboxylic transport membrane protein
MVLGAYSVNNSVFDIMIMLVFGIFAYFMKKMDFPMAPLILTLILGPQMERSLRQSLEISQGSFGIFVETPLSAALFAVAALILIAPAFKVFRKQKDNLSGEGA